MSERSLNPPFFLLRDFNIATHHFLKINFKRVFEFSSFNKISSRLEEGKLKGFMKFYIYIMRNF